MSKSHLLHWCSTGVLAIGLATLLDPHGAMAGELVYQPVNPSFGGNPFNGAHLLATAVAQDRHQDPSRKPQDDSPAAQFQRTLQSRLLSGLADQVTQALFGDHPKDSGRIVFGDLQVDFTRGAELIHIEIFDAAKNASTVIEVPNARVGG